MSPTATAERDRTGLCAGCRHARPVVSARGSTFWRCAAAESDRSLARYPRLPVVVCRGFAPAEPASGGGAG